MSETIAERLVAAHIQYLERVNAGGLAAAEREFLKEALKLARLAGMGNPTPAPINTREAPYQTALLLLHGDGECGPGCPMCEEAEARAEQEAEEDLADDPMHQLAALQFSSAPIIVDAPDDAILTDLLSLTHATIPLSIVETWTQAERSEAVEWASAEVLDASDNDITVPPMPACVAAALKIT